MVLHIIFCFEDNYGQIIWALAFDVLNRSWAYLILWYPQADKQNWDYMIVIKSLATSSVNDDVIV